MRIIKRNINNVELQNMDELNGKKITFKRFRDTLVLEPRELEEEMNRIVVEVQDNRVTDPRLLKWVNETFENRDAQAFVPHQGVFYQVKAIELETAAN